MPILDIFDKLDGMLSLVAKEKMPHYLFQKIVNWEIGEKIGWFIKRKPYRQITTQSNDAGFANVQGIIEFKDSNDVFNHVFQANALLRLITITAGTYGASAAISGGANDERTAGSTINASVFYPINIFKELRGGAGISAATQLPWWYGYIAACGRFYNPNTELNAQTIPAGKYLDEMIYNDKLAALFANGSITVSPTLDCHFAAHGIDAVKKFSVYVSPVIDGYQRGFPVLFDVTSDATLYLSPPYSLQIQIIMDSLDLLKAKRITALDLFIAEGDQVLLSDNNQTALLYFLERVYFDKMPDYWLEKTGTIDATPAAEKITFLNFADWMTHDMNLHWLYDMTHDKWLFVSSWTINGADIEANLNVTIGEAPTAGAAVLQFFSGWYVSGSDYHYKTFYDNFYHKLGSEMFAFLKLPVGDLGRDENRFKYIVWNGNRSLVAGLPSPEQHRAYYSTLDSPDVIPSLNRINAHAEITGLSCIGQDFLVFTKERIERHYILGNENSRKDLVDIQRGLVDQKALAKISDYVIAGFDYKGPWLLAGREFVSIGDELFDWWNTTLSTTVKDGCVTFYNFIRHQIWFSFPGYTDSEFLYGITFVFDLKAKERGYLSPWWILSSNISLDHFCQNYENHLLAANEESTGSKLVDFNYNGVDESVSTKIKLKMLQNPLLGRRIRWSKLRVDIRGTNRNAPTDSVTCNFYFDEETSATLSLTLNTTHFRSVVKYISQTLECELTTAASTNGLTLRSMALNFVPKRF